MPCAAARRSPTGPSQSTPPGFALWPRVVPRGFPLHPVPFCAGPDCRPRVVIFIFSRPRLSRFALLAFRFARHPRSEPCSVLRHHAPSSIILCRLVPLPLLRTAPSDAAPQRVAAPPAPPRDSASYPGAARVGPRRPSHPTPFAPCPAPRVLCVYFAHACKLRAPLPALCGLAAPRPVLPRFSPPRASASHCRAGLLHFCKVPRGFVPSAFHAISMPGHLSPISCRIHAHLAPPHFIPFRPAQARRAPVRPGLVPPGSR